MSFNPDNLSAFWFNVIDYLVLIDLAEEYHGEVYVIEVGQSNLGQEMLAVIEFSTAARSSLFELKYSGEFKFVDLTSDEYDWFESYWRKRKQREKENG